MTAIAAGKLRGGEISSFLSSPGGLWPASPTGQGMSEPARIVIQKVLEAQISVWKSIVEYSPVAKEAGPTQALANLRTVIHSNLGLAGDADVMAAASGAVRRMEGYDSIDPDRWAAEIAAEFAKYKD